MGCVKRYFTFTTVFALIAAGAFFATVKAQSTGGGAIYSGIGVGGGTVTTSTQAGTSYTLVAGDCNSRILFTAATAVTLTVPAGLGATCAVDLVQQGAGNVTPTASSTTIHQSLNLTKTARQYARISLYATAADVYNLDGELQ